MADRRGIESSEVWYLHVAVLPGLGRRIYAR